LVDSKNALSFLVDRENIQTKNVCTEKSHLRHHNQTNHDWCMGIEKMGIEKLNGLKKW
jgi:hypothetical protein